MAKFKNYYTFECCCVLHHSQKIRVTGLVSALIKHETDDQRATIQRNIPQTKASKGRWKDLLVFLSQLHIYIYIFLVKCQIYFLVHSVRNNLGILSLYDINNSKIPIFQYDFQQISILFYKPNDCYRCHLKLNCVFV